MNAIGAVVFKGGKSDDPLRSGRKDDPALDRIAPKLSDVDPKVRVDAAFVLACNDRGEQAVSMLAKLVSEQPEAKPLDYLASRAILSLMVLAVRSEKATEFLVSELGKTRDGYPDRLRDCLLWDVKQSSEARERILKQLTAALGSDEPSLRHNAAILMHRIGSGQTAVIELVEALQDESVPVRLQAIEALLDIGPIDPSIRPAIEDAVEDTDEEVQFRALGALQAFELNAAGPPVVP